METTVKTSVLEWLKQMPYVRRRLGLKMALCQHPMYLLVDEDRGDPVVGERVLPWGAPDAATYVERVRRNLASLDRFPDLRLNYEFSAVEVESLAREYPDVAREMRRHHERGALDFVNGTFSQAHLQVFGAESNWRQIEHGLQIFERLFGRKVKVYATQETGLHQQLPQLLKLCGYELITAPSFPWVMEVIGGLFEVGGSHQGKDILAGDEFIAATALDGTSLPFYINEDIPSQRHHPQTLESIDRDLYAIPPVWAYFPDLIEVEESWYSETKVFFDFALLEPALKERLKKAPPRARARIYTYWSYMEGVWAEELLRKNKEAEEMAVLAEAVHCMSRSAGLSGYNAERNSQFHEIWHTILKYQHHDVYWIEVTDLRRKAVNLLGEGIEKCRRIMNETSRDLLASGPGSVTVFNGCPQARRCLITAPKSEVPAAPAVFQEFEGGCLGFVDLPAGGWRSFDAADGSARDSKTTPLPMRIDMDHYSLDLSPTGLMRQITPRNGNPLLCADQYVGGEIRALIAEEWVDNREGESRFFRGPVCDILRRETALGCIPIKETYYLFRHEPFIKVELEFDFDGNEVGLFWMDETKINVYWPTTGGEIYHDIPFGYIQGREERPLLAINWVYAGGLVYVNRGTVKHWVRDGVLANVIGWGGSQFDNRMHFDFWTSKPQYDVRLYGRQKIEYYLIPKGSFDGPGIVRAVNALTAPVFIAQGRGERSCYAIPDKDLAVTAIYDKDGEVCARGYKLPSADQHRFRDWEVFNRPLRELV